MIKYLRFKDFKKRKKFNKNQNINLILKSILIKEELNNKFKFKFMLKNQQLLNYNFKSKIINRCIISNKIRSVNRITGLTKNSYKQYFDYGNIMGFKKSSW